MTIDKDFSRNVWCLLGLPFDAITIKQAEDEVVAAIAEGHSCFISTPNLNYLCAAQSDSPFQQSVINSDLSVADGFPLVLVAKLLKIPLPERVAGSDLIDHLNHRITSNPLKVFFFGGEPGTGELASKKINENPSGLVAVGNYTPGFGSVSDMSTPEIIDYINQHDIDFLIVAISAKKGQTWIEQNRASLKAPVISHLGAVINFFAGTVNRAPTILRKTGMEWLWRIYQEPALWRRYFNDSKTFLKLFITCVIPYWLWQQFNKSPLNDQPTTLETNLTANVKHIFLSGQFTHRSLSKLRKEFKIAAIEKHDVIIDFSNVTLIDSAFLGLCLLLFKHLYASGHTLSFVNANKTIQQIMEWNKVSSLFL